MKKFIRSARLPRAAYDEQRSIRDIQGVYGACRSRRNGMQPVYIDQCRGYDNYRRSVCLRGVTEKAKIVSEREYQKILCWNCITNRRRQIDY